MLIVCPECELQVSDKAITCPHCGYPMHEQTKKRKPRNKNNKRRRLPNGFGQISEIKNRNLRNPFRAMVTVGKTEEGRPICKPLKPESYFATYNEAYQALVEYNKNPYDLDPGITMEELFDRWFPEYEKKVVNAIQISSAWSYCSAIYKMRVTDIRARHIKDCMENGTARVRNIEQHPTAYVKTRIKSLFNLMLDYALEYELVDKNYARTFNIDEKTIKDSQKVNKDHISFTDEEMKKLWNSVGIIPGVDIVLIQCYSGWRPQELGLIETKNVNIKEWTFKGGVKTEAGIDRTVPIHSKIRALVEAKYNEAIEHDSKYLFNIFGRGMRRKDSQLTYYRYQKILATIISMLDMNPEHRPHDGRKHFVTMAKRYNVDEYAIKYIVGHTITDITEKVYTERQLEWLKAEIEKIQ